MGTCTSAVDLFVLAFKLQVDCDTLGRSRRLVGAGSAGKGAGNYHRLACTRMGFYFPPTLVAKYLELWIVHAMGYLQRRLPLQREYLAYEYELVPPIRTVGGTTLAAAVTSSYAIRNLSM